MPEHPLRAVRLYVDWQAYGFQPPALHDLPVDVADDLRFLVANVELPEREDEKRDMRDREDD